MGRVAVITPTDGNREAFKLISRWVGHQTRQPDLWVLANDERTRKGQRSKGAVARNYVRALEAVPEDYAVVVMEYDDYYGPLYVENMAKALDGEDFIVGPRHHRHYHIDGAWHSTDDCAAQGGACSVEVAVPLSFTGIGVQGRYRALQAMRQSVREEGMHVDFLWKRLSGGVDTPKMVGVDGVSIKGIPGTGVSAKHDWRKSQRGGHRWHREPGRLREWIGRDADVYAGL